MADENQTNEVEELEAASVEAAEAVADEIAENAEAVVEAAEEAADQVVEETADQMVEEAVKNVAEEAAADEATAAYAEVADQAAEAEPEAKKKRERRSKQARAAKAGDTLVESVGASSAAKKTLSTSAWIAISVACLALGLVLGRFLLGGGGAAASSSLNGKTAVTESELDSAYATYTYNGSSEAITVREVIELGSTLENAKNDDDTYTLPQAEYAMSVARTKILNKEIETRGIEVTDEEIATYAEDNLGTSDFEAIASQYGMDAEKVEQLIADNCRLAKLRDEIVGTDLPTMPASPDTAEEGKEDELTKEYADYILGIVGDEWDAEKGAWADEEGSYAVALDGTDFSADGASYNMAQTVYYVAYQKYNEKQTEASNAWNEFLNGLLSSASIQINSLIS